MGMTSGWGNMPQKSSPEPCKHCKVDIKMIEEEADVITIRPVKISKLLVFLIPIEKGFYIIA